LKTVKNKIVLPPIVKQIREYKSPEIDWSCQRVISHSQMSIYNSCAYKWGLIYRDKIKIPDPSIHLIFGISIHNAVQSYLDVYYNKSKAAADRLDIEMTFRNDLKSLYLEQYLKNDKKHFSTPEELDEFCMDGLYILRFFKSKIGSYFSKTGWHLVGCEIPISHMILPNVLYNGSLDIVLYHQPTNIIKIIDLKTSTRTWYDKSKKDENKLAQLLLYKKLLADQFNFPIENIEIEFMILKRKINEESEFKEKRVQIFQPASGKGKITKAYSLLENFAHSTFTEHGVIRQDIFKKNISVNSCKFCQFKDRGDLCMREGVFKKNTSLFDIY